MLKWFLRISLFIVIIILVIILLKIGCGRYVNIFGLEVNKKTPDTVKTTQTVFVRDTIPVYKTIPLTTLPKSSKPKSNSNVQNLDSGASGIQNNAPNYGNQAGRDLNIVNEKQLQEADKTALINLIDKLKRDSSTITKCVSLFSSNTSNAGKVSSQISDFLTSQGYKITSTGVSYYTETLRGVMIGYKKGCIEITVGTL